MASSNSVKDLSDQGASSQSKESSDSDGVEVAAGSLDATDSKRTSVKQAAQQWDEQASQCGIGYAADPQDDVRGDGVELAAALWDATGSTRTSVKQAAQRVDEERTAAAALKAKIVASVQSAVDEVRSSGLSVTSQMIGNASYSVSLGNEDDMEGIRQRARKSLLLDAAVHSALEQAELKFEDWTNGVLAQRAARVYLDKEVLARRAASTVREADYDAMLASALRVLSHDKSVYVVMVNGYRKEGLELVLSMSSLSAEGFDVRIQAGDSVAEVVKLVQSERRNKLTILGITAGVKLVGPAGSMLDHSKRFPEVLDYEAEDIEPDDQSTTFYPLEFLTGEAWRKTDLLGATRWKRLRETDFGDLFGMSKATFEKLPSWKQIPLKRKHGLF